LALSARSARAWRARSAAAKRWQRGWAIAGVASINQFGGLLRTTGFRRIRFRDVTQHVVPSSRRIYLASLLFYPLGLLLHWLGLRTDIQTRGIASG